MLTHIVNVRLVLPDQIVEDASLLIRNGVIDAINPQSASGTIEIDLHNALLLPGLIDLHCDQIEKDFEPRPGIFFSADFAVKIADERNMLCGITTVFQSVAFDNPKGGVRSTDKVAALVEALAHARGKTLVDNQVHVRYEIPDADSLSMLYRLIDAGAIDLLSIMDHTPGQGRSKEPADPVDYVLPSGERQGVVLDRMQQIARAARQYEIPLASHDDDSPGQVRQLRQMGAKICEFPLNIEIARVAHAVDMPTVFGAPNLLRGKSLSGDVRAIDAIEAGVADILCSDYLTPTLLSAVMWLPEYSNLDLPTAVTLATRNPAMAVGLHDRGVIAEGKRADLIGVVDDTIYPRVCAVWSAGHMVFRSDQ